MSILIRLSLFFLLTFPVLYAQETDLHALGLENTEIQTGALFSDVYKIPDSQWQSNPQDLMKDDGMDLWLRAFLPPVVNDTLRYLAENRGIQSWEFFLVKDGSLINPSDVDWSLPYKNYPENGTQFRGFSYTSFRQSPGADYTIYIRIHPQRISQYSFVISSSETFTHRQQLWSFIQGIGVGYFCMVLILSVILILKMRERINLYFLFLVLISGGSIFYFSGIGPYFVAQIFPGVSQFFWPFFLACFPPVVILYLGSFIEASPPMQLLRNYFKGLFLVSSGLIFVPLFISSELIFFFVHVTSILSSLFITAGILWMTRSRIKAARWLLPGWLIYLFAALLGYSLSAVFDSRSSEITVLCPLLSQGLLTMLFGAPMVLEMNEKFKRESNLREKAEGVAKKAVDQMSANERMAALGRLVASVTHELGTPLGVAVTLSTSLISSGKRTFELFEKNELSEDLFREFVLDVQQSSELIYRNMEQSRQLIDGFKEVASDQAMPDIRTFPLDNFMDTLQKVLIPGIKRAGSGLDILVEPGLTLTSIPGILIQVLSNLINNALIHGVAGSNEGKIKIECHKEDESIYINVEDNGKGIPPDIQDRIFDIYFTTRKGLGGTGVGLSIVQSLVEAELKGSVRFESCPGKTVFTIILPENINEN